MFEVRNKDDALSAVERAWPFIISECRDVLGSELHYQAMIYHCLRVHGQVSVSQLGMNVKMWINDPISELFKTLDAKKHQDFRGGFEPIPDVVIFSDAIQGDWRRRNHKQTLRDMLLAIEIKASERKGDRLTKVEIVTDILKLAAHREEVRYRGADFIPVMMVIDTAPLREERMKPAAIEAAKTAAADHGVELYYMSADVCFAQSGQASITVVPQAFQDTLRI